MATPSLAEDFFVRDQAEYSAALERIEAGDTITLANGEWRDFDLVITGKGRKGKLIKLVPQEAGKVILTGQSSLRVGGQYIHVEGLVFRDGYSPRGAVISFRRSKTDIASNSRVTQMVIDHFSKPDRYDDDWWVAIYGQNNRFDHNNMVGKTNKGVTLAVRLDTPESRDNNNRIDHNYFGLRPVLGSNGGETLRIGTSKYSMFTSNTTVERNIFDRTDGEVEIISSKSGGNVFRENLFLNSRGTLTLRHGDDNVVERNVFLGGGKDYTGGIRVINRNQTVRDNYMEGLRGVDFSSALAVMNGVPNSPVNRYVEVANARIENNSILDSRRVGFNVGADTERSAAPSNTTFTNNLLSGIAGESFLESYDDISGISFAGSRVAAGGVGEALSGKFETGEIVLERAENGLLYPTDPALADLGAPRDLKPVTLEQVGASYYPKPGAKMAFGGSGNTIEVMPGEDTLVDAVRAAKDGDTIQLLEGDYIVNRSIPLDKTITISGVGAPFANEGGVNSARSRILFGRPTLVEVREGGNLQLTQLMIDGALAPDSVGNSVIRTTTYPIQSNLRIALDKVWVTGLKVNKSFNVITLGKSTLADNVTITESVFSDITGTVLSASAEREDYGQYNVEYLTIMGNSFADIGGPIADVYRGGRDESTFGPFVEIEGNLLNGIGHAATNGSGSSLNIHGVQIASVSGNRVAASKPFRVVHTVGTPKTRLIANTFNNTEAFVLEELNYEGEHRAVQERNTFSQSVGESGAVN
jgi:poly(beta-D-mannuronate) lyase